MSAGAHTAAAGGLVLYDLAAADGRRFSPHCWRAVMALAHKGLDYESRPTQFTDIGRICDGRRRTVPVLEHDGEVVEDSWAIAEHLEAAWPDRPSLFGGETGRHLTAFVQNWTAATVQRGLLPMVVKDIHDHLTPADQAYFRESREKRLGTSLEEAQAGREARLEGFRAALAPLRMSLEARRFLAGEEAAYADYVVFAAFQWSRMVSPLRPLADDDPIAAWFARVGDLHGGLGRQAPGYW